MKKVIVLISVFTLIFLLAACSGAEGAAAVVENNESAADSSAAPVVKNSDRTRLNEDYAGALSVQVQLALGTLQLEETDLAVNEGLAAELLPLWRAVQSLSNSQTAADAEVQAVVNQIQDTMQVEQIAAIADLRLTEEAVTALQESGELAFGRGRGLGENAAARENAGGGFRGGGPGGGFAGGGPGGELPGGGPGGGFAELSEEERATRQAEFEAGGTAAFLDGAMTGLVVRLLEDKTGDLSEQRLRAEVNGQAMDAVSAAAGLSVQEIREQMAERFTLAEVVEAHGGDLELLRETLVEIFGGLPDAQELDLAQTAAEWLGLEE